MSANEEVAFDVLLYSFFISPAVILQQGSTLTTRMLPQRMLLAAWWIFCFVLMQCYTANLTAFLTVTHIDTPIKTVAQLKDQVTN